MQTAVENTAPRNRPGSCVRASLHTSQGRAQRSADVALRKPRTGQAKSPHFAPPPLNFRSSRWTA